VRDIDYEIPQESRWWAARKASPTFKQAAAQPGHAPRSPANGNPAPPILNQPTEFTIVFIACRVYHSMSWSGTPIQKNEDHRCIAAFTSSAMLVAENTPGDCCCVVALERPRATHLLEEK
jgi:hypothetical protein